MKRLRLLKKLKGHQVSRLYLTILIYFLIIFSSLNHSNKMDINKEWFLPAAGIVSEMGTRSGNAEVTDINLNFSPFAVDGITIFSIHVLDTELKLVHDSSSPEIWNLSNLIIIKSWRDQSRFFNLTKQNGFFFSKSMGANVSLYLGENPIYEISDHLQIKINTTVVLNQLNAKSNGLFKFQDNNTVILFNINILSLFQLNSTI
ncbi:MAG: hypothetical protein D6732_25095, partial [Methanobacteriota archaeon]